MRMGCLKGVQISTPVNMKRFDKIWTNYVVADEGTALNYTLVGAYLNYTLMMM